MCVSLKGVRPKFTKFGENSPIIDAYKVLKGVRYLTAFRNEGGLKS